MTSILPASQLIHAGADLGEGAIWHAARSLLYWIDINGCILNSYNPVTGESRSLQTGSRIGTVVPVADSDDMLVALQSGIHRMNTETGALRLIVAPITDPMLRFNDGKCDPSGRFWVGTFHMGGAKNVCTLYRLNGDGTLHTMLEGVSISNGIVWSADKKTMYYIDTPTHCVQAFDYDDLTGNISGGRIAFAIPEEEGDPDGMSIDAAGNLWIAMWGGGAVNCYNPQSGTLFRKVTLPALNTTSCAFGGSDLKTLFITSARADLTATQLEEMPLSGDLFAVKSDVAGVHSAAYIQL